MPTAFMRCDVLSYEVYKKGTISPGNNEEAQIISTKTSYSDSDKIGAFLPLCTLYR